MYEHKKKKILLFVS